MRPLRVVLRVIAYAIAIAGVLDPVWPRAVTRYESVHVVAADSASVEDAARLQAAVSELAESRMVLHDPASAASSCPSGRKCVIVSTGEIPARTDGEVIGVMRVAPERTPIFGGIETPLRAHRDAVSSVRVHLLRPAARLEVYDGDTLVGTADGSDSTTVDIPWVPVEAGARALRVVANGQRADAGVLVAERPARVLMYEPQATWLGTFVRRALENDSRFELQGRTRVAPPVSVARGQDPSLTPINLEATDVAVVSAPERLTRAEVDLLEHFVSERGGSLVVLMDQRPEGAAVRLLPAIQAERRDPEPKRIGLLTASEWLTFAPAVGVSVLASMDEQPVIVSRLVGRGRVLASGALDSWRFRGDSSFDTFWTTLAWEAASVARPALDVRTDRTAARPGEEIRVVAERRDVAGEGEWRSRADAHISCGSERHFVRLWPGPRPGTFHGTVRVDREGQCVVNVTVDGTTGTTPVTFDDEFTPKPAADRLEALAAAFNAPLATTSTDANLLNAIRNRLARADHADELRPMRSPWWLLPFATCLGFEWWLRRRSGVS